MIAGHAAVHALLVALVAMLLVSPGWSNLALAAAIVFISHLALDGARSWLCQRFPVLSDPRAGPFWYYLGVDQLGHTLVLIGVAAFIISEL